jgi:glycosyltransferase involved in cell wall biosynthesis
MTGFRLGDHGAMVGLENEGASLDYSIVIPVYYNEGMLETTFEALKETVIDRNQNLCGEVVFVDDGSGDGSLDELLRIRDQFPDLVTIIKLTRNFGQVSAINAGFRNASGRCVIAISADGQDPIDLINQMLGEFLRGTEVVIATREERDESLFRVWTSRFFYKMMKTMSFPNMPAGGFDFFLLGRRALDTILRNQEAHPFIQGQILWTGYPVKFLSYKRVQREIGVSRWSFGKRLTYLLDGVMSYSFLPIRLMSATGALVALSGFLYALVVLLDKLLWGNPVTGWAPLMIVILMLSGIQLLMLGVIGEYVWRTLAQSRQREAYVIDSIYGYDESRAPYARHLPLPPGEDHDR